MLLEQKEKQINNKGTTSKSELRYIRCGIFRYADSSGFFVRDVPVIIKLSVDFIQAHVEIILFLQQCFVLTQSVSWILLVQINTNRAPSI